MPPERLLAFTEMLHTMNPDDQSIPYKIEKWNRYFQRDADFIEVTEQFPNNIRRGNIRILSEIALHDFTQVKKLFLATMIWGFGTVGYGPYRTHLMLADPAADQMLQETLERITVGDIIGSYRHFKLNKCGPSFMTKFLYFIGLGMEEMNPKPLVLDSRVAKAFQILINDEGLDFNDFIKYSEDKKGGINVLWFPDGYINYLALIHLWSHEIQCRADTIELFLFNPPHGFWNWHGGG